MLARDRSSFLISLNKHPTVPEISPCLNKKKRYLFSNVIHVKYSYQCIVLAGISSHSITVVTVHYFTAFGVVWKPKTQQNPARGLYKETALKQTEKDKIIESNQHISRFPSLSLLFKDVWLRNSIELLIFHIHEDFSNNITSNYPLGNSKAHVPKQISFRRCLFRMTNKIQVDYKLFINVSSVTELSFSTQVKAS